MNSAGLGISPAFSPSRDWAAEMRLGAFYLSFLPRLGTLCLEGVSSLPLDGLGSMTF